MDVQSLSLLGAYGPEWYALQKSNAAATASFRTLLEELCGSQEVNDMKNEIAEKFGVTVHVVNYACEKTDSTAENYDSALLEAADYQGCGNVVISKQTLLRMEQDEEFKQKVYESIEDLKGTGNLSGGLIKSTGAFIHEDGTAGYWIEFDWGDEVSGSSDRRMNRAAVKHTHHLGTCLQDSEGLSSFRAVSVNTADRSTGGSTSQTQKNSRYVLASDPEHMFDQQNSEYGKVYNGTSVFRSSQGTDGNSAEFISALSGMMGNIIYRNRFL